MNKTLLNILILLFFALTANAQTREISNLQAEQRRTVERLALTGRLLEENKANRGSSINQLNILNEQIAERQRLISQINEEIRLLDREIVNLRLEINTQEQQLELMKNEYARIIYHTHFRRNSHNRLMFILSARTLNQSYRRMRYLREIADFQQRQAAEIVRLTESLNENLATIEKQRAESERARRERERENRQLQNEQRTQQNMIADLQQQEEELMRQLQEQERQMNEMAERISRLIAEEERRRREREERERQERERLARLEAERRGQTPPARVTEAPTTGFVMTREEELLAGNFEKNRGRMPWPVVRGVVTQRFGTQRHPSLPHVQINSRGIRIQTERDAEARSIFDGEVTQIFAIPGGNNAVIVRHGIYLTVYTNLTEIFVTAGQRVTARQRLGRIFSDSADGYKTELFFMIYKDREVLDPETFLAR